MLNVIVLPSAAGCLYSKKCYKFDNMSLSWPNQHIHTKKFQNIDKYSFFKSSKTENSSPTPITTMINKKSNYV